MLILKKSLIFLITVILFFEARVIFACQNYISNDPNSPSGAIVSTGSFDCISTTSSITTYQANENGITSSGTNVVNVNNFNIYTINDSAHGISSSGQTSRNENYGNIVTGSSINIFPYVGSYSHGIYSTGNSTSNINHYGASIATYGDESYGLISLGNNSSNINSGTITIGSSVSGNTSFAIYSAGSNSENQNALQGVITVNSAYSAAMVSDGSHSLVTNLGNISFSSSAFYAAGIRVNESNNVIQNSGNITMNGMLSNAVESVGDYNVVNNSGILRTTRSGSNAIYSDGLYATILNTGEIITSGGVSSHAIYSVGANAEILNSGIIRTSRIDSAGISSDGNFSIIRNTNEIHTTGQTSYGIGMTGHYGNVINTGEINTAGLGSHAIYENGIGNVTNSGSISTSGIGAYGIFSNNGSGEIINNSGNISTSGSSAHGILAAGANQILDNSGSITTSGSLSRGVSLSGSVTLNNSGSIVARSSNAAAIYLSSSNNTVNLNHNSIIVGDIFALNTTTGNRLNINLGAGASYAYSVTGPWTIADGNDRPFVTGSAYAAGVGSQESASEILYQRTSPISSALDRRSRVYSRNSTESKPYWIDLYYLDSSRNAGGSFSNRVSFTNYHSGFNAGINLSNTAQPLELVFNLDQSSLNLDHGNQKVDSSSLLTGLYAPNIINFSGLSFSSKALIGYADHDGDRKVFTNSLLFNGSRQIKSDYKSLYALLGISASKSFDLTDHLVADILVGIDVTSQKIRSYRESDYFAWESRTISQLQSKLQLGIEGFFYNNRGSVFARVGAENRNLIAGSIQEYSINGTNVSFNTNNKTDTYLTSQIGARVQIDKNIYVLGSVNTLHSSDSVNSFSGNVGLLFDLNN